MEERENKVGVLAIIVEDEKAVASLNEVLHGYRECIIGRMGLPYPKRNINIISLAVDADMDVLNALNGKIGRIPGVHSKMVVQKA